MNENIIMCTLGFVFSPDLSKVLLMHKNRPDFQVGKINGVGGKVDLGEESQDCIAREVFEETGCKTKKQDWHYFGNLKVDVHDQDFSVDLYTLIYKGNLGDFSTVTDEKIEWFEVSNLPQNIMKNLKWLVPLAIEKLTNPELKSAAIHYS